MEKHYKNEMVRQQVENLLELYPYCHIDESGWLLGWNSGKYTEDILLSDIDSIEFLVDKAVLHSEKGTRFGYNEVEFYAMSAVLPYKADVVYTDADKLLKEVTILKASDLKKWLLKLGFKINPKRIIWTKHFGLQFNPRSQIVVLYPFGSSVLDFKEYTLKMLDGITWRLEAGTDTSSISLICERIIR